MCMNSNIPASARQILGQIDDALTYIEIKRMSHFIEADKKYRKYRTTNYLGFERLVSCELYCRLKETLMDDIVFTEFPVLAKDRIDLWLDSPNCPVYLELKMYYSDNQGPYEKDFRKLKKMVDYESGTIAVQIHFQFYPNKGQTAERTFQDLANSLPTPEYWKNISVIGDRKLQHFVWLAFGKNKMTNPSPSFPRLKPNKEIIGI